MPPLDSASSPDLCAWHPPCGRDHRQAACALLWQLRAFRGGHDPRRQAFREMPERAEPALTALARWSLAPLSILQGAAQPEGRFRAAARSTPENAAFGPWRPTAPVAARRSSSRGSLEKMTREEAKAKAESLGAKGRDRYRRRPTSSSPPGRRLEARQGRELGVQTMDEDEWLALIGG